MIPKLLLAVLFTASLISNLYAQQSLIRGQIKNDAGNALAGATVLLYSSPDSLLVKTAITDIIGNYEISQLNAGRYFVSSSFSGYIINSTPVLAITENERITATTLYLKAEDKKLDEVVVKSAYQKPVIEVTADKIIFNVENSINATGSNAFELLQKSPGVTADKDDNITLSGKNGVRIYTDGRPVEMDVAGVAGYLRSINSADIESIEIISNPSARYDASGNAGIINIKLKKNKKTGFNGTVSAGYSIGIHPKTNGALGLNYRNKKVNIFSNYSNTWGNNENTFDLYRIQNDTLYDQKSLQNIEGWSHNIKAGTDIFIDKKSTLGFIFTGNFTDNTVYSSSRTPSSPVNTGSIEGILYATNTIPGHVKNENFNGNYHYADTAGHEINIDIDHGFYKSRKTSYQPNTYYTPAPETLLYQAIYRNNTPINITINTQKIDYTAPLKKGLLGIGAKISNVKTNNTFNLYNVINGLDYLDTARSNTFQYRENINAGYINYSSPLGKKINLQAGLRIENTDSKSLLARANRTFAPDDNVNRNYTDWFPAAAFTYTANENNLLNFNYSRRIDRPNYNDLNPFEARVDELTFIKGNAFLRPQYTNTLQVTHTFKSRYITSLSYSHVKDFSAYIIDTTEKIRTFISKQNLAAQNLLSLNFSATIDVAKWWELYGSVNMYNSRYKAYFGPGKEVKINVTSYSLYAQNTFKIGKGFTGELTGFYNGPSISAGTFKTRPMGTVDIGIQKKIFKGNGTLKISGTDILNTLRWKAESIYGGTNIIANSRWESRQLRINFSYRFGSSQIKEDRQHAPGNEDEKTRTASGGGFNN
jgi:iron complex outermembrane recepter protein